MKKMRYGLLVAAVLCVFGLRHDPRALTTETAQPVSLSMHSFTDLLESSIQLSVPTVFQLPELPNGCEVASLAAALQYFGFSADKVTLAEQYLPCAPLALTEDGYRSADPSDAYVGDPASETRGFYCFSGPIVAAASSYLEDEGQISHVKDLTGASEQDLISCLLRRQPVLVWGTLCFRAPSRNGMEWLLPDGSLYRSYSNLHCLVLKGFDEAFFYLSDPIYGEQVVPREEFMTCYETLGSHAVVLNLFPNIRNAPLSDTTGQDRLA